MMVLKILAIAFLTVCCCEAAIAEQHSRGGIERARQLIEDGASDQAIELLRKLVKSEPNNADAHLLLGTALALAPEPSQAIEHLRRAVELRPDYAPGYYTYGNALARFADLDAAGKLFEKAIELDPRLAEARISLALLLAQRREFVAARRHLTRALETRKNSPSRGYIHYLLGRILLEENEPEKALREIEEALRLRFDNAETYLSLGLIKRRLLEENEALRAFMRAVELDPNNHQARYQLGASYMRKGDAKQAVGHLRAAAELNRGDRTILSQLCQALYRTRQVEQSGACQRELTEIIRAELKAADLNAGELNNEGVELEKAGDVAAALEKYRAAVELSPLQSVFRRNFALALCRLGRWEDGITELKEVLRINPEDTAAARALYIALDNARKHR